MSRSHTSYDEIDSPVQMRADAAAAGRLLRLDAPGRLETVDAAGEDRKRDIAVDAAAARIARALGLSID